MTTYLGKSCSFGLPRVPFVNCRHFMYYVVISFFGFECRVWDLIVSVPDHCLSVYFSARVFLKTYFLLVSIFTSLYSEMSISSEISMGQRLVPTPCFIKKNENFVLQYISLRYNHISKYRAKISLGLLLCLSVIFSPTDSKTHCCK